MCEWIFLLPFEIDYVVSMTKAKLFDLILFFKTCIQRELVLSKSVLRSIIYVILASLKRCSYSTEPPEDAAGYHSD